MKIEFTEKAWADFEYWMIHEPDMAMKIKDLLRAISENPFQGIGKPEPLKYSLKGFWSRRISREHRLVYQITGKKGEDQKCSVVQCRFHYDD